MLRYFISREFLLTLVGLLLAGILTYLLIFGAVLPWYTRHGKGVTVPDVTQMSVEEAMKTLDKARLNPQVTDSIVPASGFVQREGRWVIRQYPPPFSRVKPGRLIALTVPLTTLPSVKLPNIIETAKNLESISLSDAKSRLRNANLRLGSITEQPSESNVVLKAYYNGRLLKPGDDVPYQAQIDLVVGSGKSSATMTSIPDLTGIPYEEAISLLQESFLGVGVVLYNPNGPIELSGQVYDQTPRPNFADSVSTGTSIDLFIYGEEPTKIEGIIVEELEGPEPEGEEGQSNFEEEDQ